MFAVVRHVAYHIQDGRPTEAGMLRMREMAQALRVHHAGWEEIRHSPAHRTKISADVLRQTIDVPNGEDPALSVDGNIAVYFPPQEPRDLILVTHLPVITNLLRIWSNDFGIEEPPLTELGCGCLVIPEQKTIVTLTIHH